MKQALVIALFGALGAVSRFYLVRWVNAGVGQHFPAGTLMVNVLGSFVIGLIYVLSVEKLALGPVWRMGFMIGFLGAFTTFSSFSLDTLRLLESGKVFSAGVNVVLNLLLCLGAVWLGMRLAR